MDPGVPAVTLRLTGSREATALHRRPAVQLLLAEHLAHSCRLLRPRPQHHTAHPHNLRLLGKHHGSKRRHSVHGALSKTRLAVTAELNGRFPSSAPEATPPSPHRNVLQQYHRSRSDLPALLLPGLPRSAFRPGTLQGPSPPQLPRPAAGVCRYRQQSVLLPPLEWGLQPPDSALQPSSRRNWRTSTIRIVPEHLCTTAQTIARGTTRIETSR